MAKSPASGPSRRTVLVGGARAAAGTCLAAALLTALADQPDARPAVAVRPPGALPEPDFLAACVKCGLCVRACPYDTLKLADWNEPVPVGTPYFIARTIPCEMCDDIPCVKACPSGALAPSLTRIDDAQMGLAVLIRDDCLNMKGLRCDVCYRVCPRLDKAITLERSHNTRTQRHAVFEPVVHPDACTGCGKCEQACVLEEAAIKVLPRELATAKPGSHYRYGWMEKQRNDNRELVPGLIDLPDRLPEAKP